MKARYRHTNLVAKDWRVLVDFYEKVLGCKPLAPERNHSGEWFERVTRVPGGAAVGVHMLLPGFDENGPTLEIFQYNRPETRPDPKINTLGFAHLAFEVDDVAAGRDEVLAAGGACVGDLERREIPGAGTITLIYLTDPEGNIFELQKWE